MLQSDTEIFRLLWPALRSPLKSRELNTNRCVNQLGKASENRKHKMGRLVQKFGGSSVRDAEHIRNVAKLVVKAVKEGNQVVTVVSAMGHTTDNLIDLADDITDDASAREMDMLLATGEQVSIALLAMAVQKLGV